MNRTAQTHHKLASELRPGDVVLLTGCPIADPDSDAPTSAIVGSVTAEGDHCIAVSLLGFDTVGYPPGFPVILAAHVRGIAATATTA